MGNEKKELSEEEALVEKYHHFWKCHLPQMPRQEALRHVGMAQKFDSQEDLISYQNKVAAVYGGYELEQFQAATLYRLQQVMKGRSFESLVSLGCGPGTLELWLLQEGRVRQCVLVDISPAMCRRAEEIAAKLGLQQKVQVICSAVEAIQQKIK